MSLLDRVESAIPRNTIADAELTYQQRSMRQRRGWMRRVWHTILLAGITMAMILYGGEFAGALLSRSAGPIGERLAIGAQGLLLLAFVMHFRLMFQTLSLAANSIARERENKTWDMLILTGIDARQIVLGKWWATIHHQWRSYALLAVLRVGAAIWLGASSSRNFFTYAGSYNYYGYGYTNVYRLPTPWEILYAGLAVAALTMLNLGFTAACGVLASMQIRRSALALARAISLRLLVVLGTALLLTVLTIGTALVANRILGIFAASWLENGVISAIGALLDNGVNIGGTLASIQFSYYGSSLYDVGSAMIVAAILTAVIYIRLTRLLLGRAQRQAVRQWALPPLATAALKSSKIEVMADTKPTTSS